MKAITTKFYGPTSRGGERYSATDSDYNHVFVHADYALNSEQNHDAAALTLRKKMGWTGDLIRGGLKGGNVYVFNSEHEVLVNKQEQKG